MVELPILFGFLPGEPAVVALCALAGGFARAARARRRRATREDLRLATEDGVFVGTGLGFVVYAISVVLEVVS